MSGKSSRPTWTFAINYGKNIREKAYAELVVQIWDGMRVMVPLETRQLFSYLSIIIEAEAIHILVILTLSSHS